MVTSKPRPALSGRLAIAAYFLVAVAYAVVRINTFDWAKNIEFPDSPSYLEKAASPLNWNFFFDEGRFFVVPLMYKVTNGLFGPGVTALTTMQAVLSIVAWLVFAASFARVLSVARLGFAGFVAVLAMSLSLDVMMWDRMILSESITFSLFVLFLAAWIQAGEGLTNGRAAALFAASVFYGVSREANGLILLPFSVVLLAWAFWYVRDRRRRMIGVAIAASWILITVVSTAIAHKGERWLFPLLNVIGTRVLTTPDRLAFYQAQGMPINARLMAMKGEMAAGQDWAFYKDPELEEFRRWIRANGRAVFSRDLTSNPVRSLREPLVSIEEMLCPVLVIYNEPVRMKAVLPDFGLTQRFCSPGWTRLQLLGSLGLGSLLLVLALLMRRRIAPATGFKMLTLAAMLLGWPPFLWFTWQVIGGMEISRHSLSGTYELRLALLLMAGYLAMAVRHEFLREPTIDTTAAVTAD
jgi:hypothetical protein